MNRFVNLLGRCYNFLANHTYRLFGMWSKIADVAQLVEHSTRNTGVIGSNPIVGSIKKGFGIWSRPFCLSLYTVVCLPRWLWR